MSTNAVCLQFQDLARKADLPLENMRLLRHAESRAKPGHSPYELWRDQRTQFERYQSEHGPDAHGKLKRTELWASFIGTPSNETMFVGMYETAYVGPSTKPMTAITTGVVVPAGRMHLYRVTLLDALAEYSGRLFVEWGAGTRAWVQKATRAKPIVEIRKTFKEPDFPGHTHFTATLSSIPGMPATWKTALQSVRGIYVLTCPETKELYVGSAYGSGGFLSRWMQYAVNGHGGNIQLKSRDRSDYQVSILEVAGSNASDEEIIGLETLWKQKLQTKKMGLNSN